MKIIVQTYQIKKKKYTLPFNQRIVLLVELDQQGLMVLQSFWETLLQFFSPSRRYCCCQKFLLTFSQWILLFSANSPHICIQLQPSSFINTGLKCSFTQREHLQMTVPATDCLISCYLTKKYGQRLQTQIAVLCLEICQRGRIKQTSSFSGAL